jgi:hypothetical protein
VGGVKAGGELDEPAKRREDGVLSRTEEVLLMALANPRRLSRLDDDFVGVVERPTIGLDEEEEEEGLTESVLELFDPGAAAAAFEWK